MTLDADSTLPPKAAGESRGWAFDMRKIPCDQTPDDLSAVELERNALLEQNQRQQTTIALLRGVLVKLGVHLYTHELLLAQPEAVIQELLTSLHRDLCTLNSLEALELRRTLMGAR